MYWLKKKNGAKFSLLSQTAYSALNSCVAEWMIEIWRSKTYWQQEPPSHVKNHNPAPTASTAHTDHWSTTHFHSTWGNEKLTKESIATTEWAVWLCGKDLSHFSGTQPTSLCCSPHKCTFLPSVAPFQRRINRLSNDKRCISKEHCYNLNAGHNWSETHIHCKFFSFLLYFLSILCCATMASATVYSKYWRLLKKI